LQGRCRVLPAIDRPTVGAGTSVSGTDAEDTMGFDHLFIDDLADTLTGARAAMQTGVGSAPDDVTTLALGEEGEQPEDVITTDSMSEPGIMPGGCVTTASLGEEG
jgi:hypothetical protein